MHDSDFLLPSRTEIVSHCLNSLARYWPGQRDSLKALPMQERNERLKISPPLTLVDIVLPVWAHDCGIDCKILVPKESCGRELNWESVDWWLAVFILLECCHERALERLKKPIHSYSMHLKDWDARVWDAAWVNRIALFLRRWAARTNNQSEQVLFGECPQCEIFMTHDVDAISKTLPIRLKQGVFNLFNSWRSLLRGDLGSAGNHLIRVIRFVFSMDNWDKLERMLEMEQKAGVKSQFFFFAKTGEKSVRSWLFDPSYRLDAEVKALVKRVVDCGGEIGLHPGFDSWNDESALLEQRLALRDSTGMDVATCRQHWLRFSWKSTWKAQESAGLRSDATLMFNDRPGFRASAALRWSPWNHSRAQAHGLSLIPTVLMDSHFYDYQAMNSMQRRTAMSHWIRECVSVGGQMAVLWHPHTLSTDYGWEQGFEDLLSMVTALKQ